MHPHHCLSSFAAHPEQLWLDVSQWLSQCLSLQIVLGAFPVQAPVAEVNPYSAVCCLLQLSGVGNLNFSGGTHYTHFFHQK